MASDISFSYPAYPYNPANPGSDKVGYGNPHYNGWTEVGVKNFTHPNPHRFLDKPHGKF